MRINNRSLAKQFIFIGLVILFIVGALLLFLKANSDRIVAQNESYIEDVAIRSAERIESLLNEAENTTFLVTTLYSDSFESPGSIDSAFIESLSDHSVFDYMEFISADGMDHTAEGTSGNVRDRDYFLDGMKGNSGISTIDDSEIISGTLFVFYAPMRYRGNIVGVLCGFYTEESMEEIISTEVFGTQAKNYLLRSDGTVLAATNSETPFERMLDNIRNYGGNTGNIEDNIRNAFENKQSFSASYVTASGIGSAYFVPLHNTDWILMQTLPSSVAGSMMNRADSAGIMLVAAIVIAFTAYIVFLLILKRRQTKQLMNENEEFYSIIKSINALFVRFSVIDLKHDRYHYIEKSDGMPETGTYSGLMDYMRHHYVDEDDTVSMNTEVTVENIQKKLTEDVPYLQYEYHIIRDGIDRWENGSIICLKREKGKPVSVLYAIQDVTPLKKAERESRIALKNAFDAAESANRAKSEFLSRMSHDIRTPMNAIMGMTAVAAMHLDDKERVTDCLNKINVASKHLLSLINDVLDMSKIESGKVTLSEEPFNLAEMTDSLITIMHPQIKAKNQQLSMVTSRIQHEDVIGDTLRLRQVFVNIMGNAVKFTPEGGKISLSIRELESHITGKACYEFVFTDTGIGMEPEYIDKIFDPFSRSERSVEKKIEGTGLGMSIARNIVRMMDGGIKVESTPGEGSKFTVQIYLTTQDADAGSTECLENLKILVADDDKDAAENTGEILKSIGMDASWVFSGEDAVSRVTEQHESGEDFAAVILDWKMPGMDGVEAAREIRRKVGEDMPIVILSAYDWTDIEQEAREVGVNAFIAKPLFRSRLVYVLRSSISQPVEEKTTELSKFAANDFSGKRVLLTEDNEINREVACELLGMIGVEVEMAFDGQIALNTLLEKPAGYYDLVFMDIQMPNMNGYEAAKAIRASGRPDLKEIPIVAMSADAFSDDVHRALECGMNDHVSKPVEIAKLSAALQKWLK